ncbi:hypothetical protein ACLMAB_03335 [Brevibacillus laterosporus]
MSADIPTEKEIQVPPGLTEPFFVPFMRPLLDADPLFKGRQPFPFFALVSPTGKIIASQEFTDWPGYISPFRNGYGFFKTGVMFKYSEYIIYDKQGNIQATASYDNSFSQIDGEWFYLMTMDSLTFTMSVPKPPNSLPVRNNGGVFQINIRVK